MPIEFVPRPGILRPAALCRGQHGRPRWRLLVAGLLTGLLACSSPSFESTLPQTWEQRLAAGRLQQAEVLLEQGDTVGARRTAEVALAEARQAAHSPTIARAMALVGALRGDVIQLQEALARLERLGDAEGVASARFMLAEVAVRAGRADIAVPAMEAAVAALPDSLSAHMHSARAEARVYHLQAAALRLARRYSEAASAERRAALCLSVLPDNQQLALRTEIAQACGDDLYRAFDARGAVARHAQAANCARLVGDQAAELRAIASMAADFGLDGQWHEAADHSERALRLALDLSDPVTARDAAARGLQALRALREPESSPRWRIFEQALVGG